MKGRVLLIIFIFAALNSEVLASGKKDTAPVKTQNNEWILCITNFDTKTLPLEKAVVVPVLARKMVERLNTISYRTRISPEYAYYEGFAWSRARAAAAKAIASKMDERSSEIYKGNPKWRYDQNIARIDKDLIKLRTALEVIEDNAPVINNEPAFKLTSGSNSLNFPAAPAAGGESAFCLSQNADAFLAGAIVDFHGRFLLSLKLYVSYTKTFVWEDRIVFSQEDIDPALDDILQKLMIVLGGNEPAIVSITAEPEETLVLINKSFAGRGSTGNLEYPPSTIIVTAVIPDHESVTFKADLSAAEITEINIRLAPIQYEDVNILGDPESRIYHGALYVGNAPLTLRLPVHNLEYIEMISPISSTQGKIVFEAPGASDVPPSFAVRTRPSMKKNSVDLHRRIFYWGWGSTWITGIAAWISHYTYIEANKAYNVFYNPDLYNDLRIISYVRTGAFIALGVAGSFTVYRFIRYLITANRDATSVTKPVKVRKSKVNIVNDVNLIVEEDAEDAEEGE
ncbi:MAG: hypothetical protein FWB73_03820 [Treponema sp.]|nr:hypothetical protein [Treponema sp.]